MFILRPPGRLLWCFFFWLIEMLCRSSIFAGYANGLRGTYLRTVFLMLCKGLELWMKYIYSFVREEMDGFGSEAGH